MSILKTALEAIELLTTDNASEQAKALSKKQRVREQIRARRAALKAVL